MLLLPIYAIIYYMSTEIKGLDVELITKLGSLTKEELLTIYRCMGEANLRYEVPNPVTYSGPMIYSVYLFSGSISFYRKDFKAIEECIIARLKAIAIKEEVAEVLDSD